MRSEFKIGPVRWEAWVYGRGAASKVGYRGFTVKLSDITTQGDPVFCIICNKWWAAIWRRLSCGEHIESAPKTNF